MNDEDFMRLALVQAQQAYALGEVPVGAVVVQHGQVIATGFNQPISSTDPSAHAEVVALRQAAKQLNNYRLLDCTLYVTVEPCTMCAGLLIHSRIARVVFGTTEPKAGAMGSALNLPAQPFYNHVLKVDGGVLAAQCSQLMSDFFAKRREQKKAQRPTPNT
ncbi:MAG: hypothetical protein RL217_289 [Pseudomonadota bacterium]|jgi:tRNA(Arg) A34 adenosine deaminase TadA